MGDSQPIKSLNQCGEQVGRFAIARAVALREDLDGSELRRLAKVSQDAGQSRRLLALAEIYDGGQRRDAARIGDVGLQVVRGWALRFNTKGPVGLIDGKAMGSTRNPAQSAQGSTDSISIYLQCHLFRARCRRGPRFATWQFMRNNRLSNRIVKSYNDIVALCCESWNKLIEQPWKIMPIGQREWAHGF